MTFVCAFERRKKGLHILLCLCNETYVKFQQPQTTHSLIMTTHAHTHAHTLKAYDWDNQHFWEAKRPKTCIKEADKKKEPRQHKGAWAREFIQSRHVSFTSHPVLLFLLLALRKSPVMQLEILHTHTNCPPHGKHWIGNELRDWEGPHEAIYTANHKRQVVLAQNHNMPSNQCGPTTTGWFCYRLKHWLTVALSGQTQDS